MQLLDTDGGVLTVNGQRSLGRDAAAVCQFTEGDVQLKAPEDQPVALAAVVSSSNVPALNNNVHVCL